MRAGGSILEAWGACRGWVARRDGRSSELIVLDIPEERLGDLLGAIRSRGRVVAALGADGPESFADTHWMPGDDDDLIMSVFFIVIHAGMRLQHFLSPSRPRSPGPWVAVSRGPCDLEIAFWPDEVFPARVGEDEHARAFARLVRYASELCGEAGGSAVLVTHACDEDPRIQLATGGLAYQVMPGGNGPT